MPPKAVKAKTIEETYQKKTQLEHVLHRPGMYIGDIDHIISERWVIQETQIIKKNLSFSPGLYKIFDEIFTNATDHSQRDQTMKKIEVNRRATYLYEFATRSSHVGNIYDTFHSWKTEKRKKGESHD